MTRAQLHPGRVRAPRLGGAVVTLDSGRTVRAANALNLRTPPGSRVLVARDDRGAWAVVGRER